MVIELGAIILAPAVAAAARVELLGSDAPGVIALRLV